MQAVRKIISIHLMARLKKLSLCSWILVGATIFLIAYPNNSSGMTAIKMHTHCSFFVFHSFYFAVYGKILKLKERH